jgi:diguanylate cyclase (GGDEF)-like protein
MRRPPLWLVWLLGGIAFGLGQLGIVGYGHLASDLYLHVFTLSCIVGMLLGVHRNRPPRRAPWYLITGAVVLNMGGDLTWTVCDYLLHVDLNWPTPIDGIYLSTYGLFAAGLFQLVRARTSGGDRGGLVDAAIVTMGAGLVSFLFLLKPIFADQSLGVVGTLVSLGYPLGDLLLLVMLARLLASPGAKTASYWYMVAAMMLNLGADTVFTLLESYQGGGYLDLLWSGSNLCWAVAALHPSMRSLSTVDDADGASRFTRWRLATLAAASLLAPAMLAVQGIRQPAHIDWLPITVSAVGLFLLVVIRMAGLVNQVRDQAEQLAGLANRDALTGIANRRAWDTQLALALAFARRTGTPLTIALIDLDHFKRYNDTLGHQAGDALLSEAATAWRAALRPMDLLARYGGEEFGVLLPGLPADQGGTLLERLRSRTPDGQTFSAGVATWNGVETADELVGRADGALYEAKRAGRDRLLLSA